MTTDPEIVELARTFDVHCPHLAEPVHEVLTHMRDQGGVNWVEAYGGHWALTSRDAVFRAAQDWQHFSNAMGISPSHTGKERKFVPIEYDPPTHRAWRRILNPVFSPQEAAKLEPDMRIAGARLIDAFAGNASAELMTEYARPVQGDIFFKHIFGLPDEEVAECRKAATEGVFAEDIADRLAGFKMVSEHCKRIYDEREERAASSTVIQALNEMTIDGEGPTEEEYRGALELLIFGGNETTVNALGNVLCYLATHPEHRQQARQSSNQLDQIIEESLRLESPVVWNGRTAVEDVEFDGHQIKAGQKVQLAWMSANRDESAFERPDEFDIARAGDHLSFGAGPHRCLGSHLARSILKCATAQLLARLPDFHLADGAEVRHSIGDSRGIIELPVVFTPAD